MEEYDLNEIIKQDADKQTVIHLKEAYARWGIEGTEEKIIDLYKLTPGLRDYMLRIHYKILKKQI